MHTTDHTAETLAARILNRMAGYLDQHATTTHPLGGHQTDQCMTQGRLDTALWNTSGTLDHIPGSRLRNDAWKTARATLPPIGGTVAEYANQLRALAA